MTVSWSTVGPMDALPSVRFGLSRSQLSSNASGVTAHYVAIADLGELEPEPDPSWPQRIGGTLAMVGRGLPYVLRRKSARKLALSG